MSYELLVLPVPPGAEIEEAGEALEVRLAGGHVFHDRSATGDARRRSLAAVATAADATLSPTLEQSEGRIVLAGDGAVEVEIDARFVAVRMGYGCAVDEAEDVFARVFRVVSAVVRETGWRVYDPQEARAVDPGEDGRETTLEIFLTVLDQLRPR